MPDPRRGYQVAYWVAKPEVHPEAWCGVVVMSRGLVVIDMVRVLSRGLAFEGGIRGLGYSAGPLCRRGRAPS